MKISAFTVKVTFIVQGAKVTICVVTQPSQIVAWRQKRHIVHKLGMFVSNFIPGVWCSEIFSEFAKSISNNTSYTVYTDLQ